MGTGSALAASPLALSASAKSAEAFKAGFPQYITEELLLAFEDRLHFAAHALIEAYDAPDAGRDGRREAVVNYGAMVMIQHDLLYPTERSSADSPAWLWFGRTDLRQRMSDDPGLLVTAWRTPFFSEDGRTQRSLHAVVNASIVPYGNYSPLELGRGVAGKQIGIRHLSYTSLT